MTSLYISDMATSTEQCEALVSEVRKKVKAEKNNKNVENDFRLKHDYQHLDFSVWRRQK